MKSLSIKRLTKSLSNMPYNKRASFFLFGMFTCLILASTAFGAGVSPWEIAAGSISDSLKGPFARSISLIAVLAGGLTVAFGEGQMKKTLGGIGAGVGMLMGASTFLDWISPTP